MRKLWVVAGFLPFWFCKLSDKASLLFCRDVYGKKCQRFVTPLYVIGGDELKIKFVKFCGIQSIFRPSATKSGQPLGVIPPAGLTSTGLTPPC